MSDSNFEEKQPLDSAQESENGILNSQTQPVRLPDPEPSQGSNLDETASTPTWKSSAEELPDEPPGTLAGAGLNGYEETSGIHIESGDPSAELPKSDQAPPSIPTGIKKTAKAPRLPWFFFPMLGGGILLIVLLLSGFGGYASGINLRKSAEKTQVAHAVVEQFQLGLQDMELGAYGRARQRFEYVIRLDPGFPEASEKLAEVLLEINTTATPTLLPTATLTPTPDMRDAQQYFDQAQQALSASDWSAAIDHLLALRKTDAAFHAVEVDGMLFLALRNRGRDRILKEADLEGGIYDLTLAKKFGPLDAEAEGLLNWSSLYITGASFWGIDWEQAVNYFSQVAPQLPNLMDGSKMTATERLRLALFEYGNVLAGRGQYCKAVRAYQDSLAIAYDPAVQQAGELAAKGCEQGDAPQKTPKPGTKPKPTVIP